MNEQMRLAKVGYEAYRANTGGISLASGQPIPPFEMLKDEIKEAWSAAAQAISAESRRRALQKDVEERLGLSHSKR